MPRMGLTPDKIVLRAAEMADSRGIDALSLSALAQELDVRVPSLYKHISGIEDLMVRLAEHAGASLGDVLERAVDGKTGRDALSALAGEYVRYVGEHPGLFGAVQRRRASDTGPGMASSRIDKVLAGIAADYDLTGEDAEHAARTVRSALHGLACLGQDGSFDSPDATLDAMVGILDRGLAGIGSGGRRGGFRLGGLSIGR